MTIFPDAGVDQAGVYEVSLDRNSRSTLNKGYIIKQLATSRIWPVDGKETIRASLNDRNIALRVEKFRNDNIGSVKWFKFDYQRYREIEVVQNSNSEIGEDFLLFKKVTTRDSGIYRASIESGDSAYFHLIIRACPEGKFMLPFCVRKCPNSCLHGGICDELSGKCLCPVGTFGEKCEGICEQSYFGDECQLSCNSGTCARLQFCKKKPVGCNCANGYYGLECSQRCPAFKFGPDCALNCQCVDIAGVSINCDRFTGKCPEGAFCKPGFSGDTCHQKCPIGTFGFTCSKLCNCFQNSTCDSVSGICPPIVSDPLGCAIGYKGNDCQELINGPTSKNSNGILIGVLLPSLLALFSGVGVLLYRKFIVEIPRITRPKSKAKNAWG